MQDERHSENDDPGGFPDVTDDPAASQQLAEALEVFSSGKAGAVLQEMADEVQSGRVSLSQAVEIGTYSEAMISASQPFRDEWSALSDAEREELAEQGRALLAGEAVEAVQQAQAERHDTAERSRGPRAHDARGWSL